MNYPVCKKEEYQEEHFGVQLSDPYRWLTDRHDPEVLAWVKEENEYTDAWFEKEEIAVKIEELKEERLKTPYQGISAWGDGLAATRMEDGIYSLVRLDRAMKDETVIMERNTVKDFTPCELKICPCDENIIAVFGLYDGEARPTVLIIDCERKSILAELKESFGSAWSKTRPVIYYSDTVADAGTQKSTSRVWAYFAETGERECIFEDAGYSVFGSIYASSDKKYIMMEIMSDYSHSRFYAYEEETGKITDISAGQALEMKYIDSASGNHYFISKETTPFGQVLAVPDGRTTADAKVIRPEGKEVLDSGFILKGKLYIMMMSDVCSGLIRMEEGQEQEIRLPSDMGTLVYSGRSDKSVFLKFESFTDAPMLLEFDGEKLDVLSRSSDRTYPDVVVEQRFAPSTGDGRMIPYFMVHRKDVKADGNNRVWIYAYGGYNMSMVPGVTELVTNLNIPDWAENGGIYILASLRGGNEYGTVWHVEGMGMNKKNCYYDFIGVTEQVIRENWTNPEKIVISGCSNGGLLMSALVTMRPDLFRCVINSVPHTDMIQFAQDDRGPMYITEYGNPRESKEMFEYLLSYSPYHNAKKADYPCIYIQTGECDNNVPPYHAKKLAARLQEANQNKNPILLRVLEKGSHDRGVGEVYWQTIAEMQLFVEKALGI